jgi:hypothetical protein
MRWTVLICLVGCNFRNPSVEITSPPSGTVITDHGSSTIELNAWDVTLNRVELAIDGQTLNENLSVSPRLDGRDCDPCNVKIVWPTKQVGEGLHVISAFVFDDGDNAGVGDVALTFDDTPEIVTAQPQDEDLKGVGTVNVRLDVLERGPLTVDLEIDGTSVGTKSEEPCRNSGCSLFWPWDTRTLPAGPHVLHWTATDSHGHKTEATHTVQLDDIIQVRAITVGNVVDDVAPLEIEVYAFDNMTGGMLGCAGSAHGLGGVDVGNTHYDVSATLVDSMGTLGASKAKNAVRFEVWEDDDAPVCPTILNPQGNDLVGASSAKTMDEWKMTTAPVSFGNVPELQIAIGRPLTR